MAEGRMLKKKISLDGRWARLANDTYRMIFTVGIAHLDIEGRISGDPTEFKGAVTPLLNHITEELILAFFKDAQRLALIKRYKSGGRWVVYYPGFQKNQQLRPDKEAPSQYPAPPCRDKSGITPGEVPELDGTTPAEKKGKEKKRREVNRKEVKLTEGNARKVPKDLLIILKSKAKNNCPECRGEGYIPGANGKAGIQCHCTRA